MQHPAQAIIGGAFSIGAAIERGRQERLAERAAIAEDVSQARAASAVRKLGMKLAASHRREETLQAELDAWRLRALAAEGKLLRLARR